MLQLIIKNFRLLTVKQKKKVEQIATLRKKKSTNINYVSEAKMFRKKKIDGDVCLEISTLYCNAVISGTI